MKNKTYTGFLQTMSWGEGDDILYLGDAENPLAERLEEDLACEIVSARYYVCERECTIEEAQESFVRQLSGEVETDVGAHYSEVTGYLWTDEEVKIGGHDLIAELHSYVGKWLILICDIQ